MPRSSLQCRRVCRRGLTLLELVVVMAILVALAGIVVPLLPGMIGRAETSARATNSGEIYKAIQMYEAAYTRYPQDWDALIDSSSTAIPAVGGFTGGTPALAVTNITDPQASALKSAGITRVQLMDATVTGTNITFNPYPAGSDKTTAGLAITTGASLKLATLTPAGQFQLNLSDTATTSSGVYVVFGLGKRCSLIGTGALEAPVNFFDNAALSPDTRYSRYGVVFQVNGFASTGALAGTANDFARAKLVRIFRFGGTLQTGDDALKSYWDDVATTGGS